MKEKYPLTKQVEIDWAETEQLRICEIFQKKTDMENKEKEKRKSTLNVHKIDQMHLVYCIVSDECKPLF